MNSVNVAVIGATGVIGRETIKILFERQFPIKNLYLLASSKSKGKIINFGKEEIIVESLDTFDFKKVHIAFFCAGSEITKIYIEKATKNNCIVIDKSSLFRMDPEVPLIIPEINGNEIKNYKNKNIIANPNCTVSILSLALKPLEDLFKIKRVVVSTYQSVSGTGQNAIDELFKQTKQYYEGITLDTMQNFNPVVYPKKIAFNCIPQCDSFTEEGDTKEELKMINECSKIFGRKIPMSATCIRVPVFRCHAESVNVELEKGFNMDDIFDVFRNSPGLTVYDRRENGGYMTQIESPQINEISISRIRRDYSLESGLNFWCVGDNLRKGGALNGVQIAEILVKEHIK